MTVYPPIEQRLWPQVERSTSCWLWTGKVNNSGYGSIRFDGRSQLVHRVSYQLCVGAIPDGLEIDHLCRVRCCVRPDHLELVTHGENVRRGTALITECPAGHLYTDQNTRVRIRGTWRLRECRQCNRERNRRYRKHPLGPKTLWEMTA